MKSSITIAVSSVCNNEILTDRLNKIQLRTVWCPINFYFCSKQTMNLFFHSTFAWICVDFSCQTAFISYHVMSAKTRVLKCCCLLFDWTEFSEFWERSTLLNRELWLAYDDFRGGVFSGVARMWSISIYPFFYWGAFINHYLINSLVNYAISSLAKVPHPVF